MSILIFDLETVKQDDEVILKNAPEWSEEEALTRKGNRTKPETISAFLEEDRENYRRNLLEKAALNPETATVAIVGIHTRDGVSQIWLDKLTEKDLIEDAINEIQVGTVIGWNIFGFDLPFLIRRAWILGIKVPSSILDPMSRYPIPDRFVDGMKLWQAGNFKASYTSLSNALKAVGLPGKPDGSEFAKMWLEDKKKALAYNEDELRSQAQLYRRMGVNV